MHNIVIVLSMTAVRSIVLLAWAAIVLIFAAGPHQRAQAAYFRLDDRYEPVCFTEELGDKRQLVKIEYNRRHAAASTDVTVVATVTSPTSRTTVLTAFIKEGSGVITFRPVADELGEYDICLVTPSITANMGQHVDISIAIDHQDRKPLVSPSPPGITRQKFKGQDVFTFADFGGEVSETLRSHEFLQRVTMRLDSIADGIDEAKTEAARFTQQSVYLRSTSESTFSRVWGFSVLTIGVVVVASWLQYASLKQFLLKKKRV